MAGPLRPPRVPKGLQGQATTTPTPPNRGHQFSPRSRLCETEPPPLVCPRLLSSRISHDGALTRLPWHERCISCYDNTLT